MNNTVLITMTVFMGCQAVRAVYASLKKERMMVREGSSPLPTSVWVFLGIELLVSPPVAWFVGAFLMREVPMVLDNLWLLGAMVAISYTCAVVVARVFSVCVAWVVKVIMVSKHKRAIKGNQEEEFAEYIKAQMNDKR